MFLVATQHLLILEAFINGSLLDWIRLDKLLESNPLGLCLEYLTLS